jgi:2-dehydropantoate 2-reductase
MRICVIGAGAIGGLLAVRLANAGEEVTVVARGANLEAIAARGLTLIEEDGARVTPSLRAVARIADAGVQDVVILGMKAQQVADVVDDLDAICHSATMVVTAQNGIPWWYFCGIESPHAGHVIESVDPGGRIMRRIAANRVIGTVVYPAAQLEASGLIRLIEGNRFSLAELDGLKTQRALDLSQTLTRAGFKAPVVSDLRSEIWTKLWGNMSFNPISALTGATLAAICQFDLTRKLAADMMAEAQAVGEALGIRFRIPIAKRIAGAEAVGEHKTSMLQDVEAGRALEVDALVGSIVELGRLVGVRTPMIEAIYACTKLLSDRSSQRSG